MQNCSVDQCEITGTRYSLKIERFPDLYQEIFDQRIHKQASVSNLIKANLHHVFIICAMISSLHLDR